MPPKHKLGRKRSETQSNTRMQCVQSSTSDLHTVHSTIPDSTRDGKSSLDTHSISCSTDVVTITANDRHYVRVSIQILQYELKRKRMNIEELLEQAHLEGDEISLPTSIPSDWRLVLQDSITTDALRQGCLSLFELVNSGLNLTQIDVVHAVRFLQYATIHIEHRKYPRNKLLEAIFPEEEHSQTKLTSALIKLVCHPSDKLRTVALSFFDVGISKSSDQFTIAMAATGVLTQLFKHLKPHAIPINGTTIDLHRHITSIVDICLSCSSRVTEWHHVIHPPSSRAETRMTKLIDPIFQPFCEYLRHLLAPPNCSTDSHLGIPLLSKMSFIDCRLRSDSWPPTYPDLKPFCDEMRKSLLEEFPSSLNLTTEGPHRQLFFGKWRMTDELHWTETFENILVRLSEGKQCSDLGLEAIQLFMFHRPRKIKLVFRPNGTFSIEENSKRVSSMERPTNSLCTLLTPTRPDHAASILAHISSFTTHLSSTALLKDIQNGWFSGIFETFAPSKLPFTSEFIPLHTQLVYLMKDYLTKVLLVAAWNVNHRSRSDLNRSYLSFIEQTKDYIFHLSLHPFAFVPHSYDNFVLDFFANFFGSDFENSVTKPNRDEVRKEMDAAALSSSSPPFILTSELVCPLTDEEIMNVVDRIVALIESDSPIDDDTILRICAFHTNQLKSVYLPELFRQAGRTTEQYFLTLNSLLTVSLDYFQLSPISSLLTPKPTSLQPTLDEWDDVDLATVGVLLRSIDENRLSFKSSSSQLLQFAGDVMPQLSHCAVRLTPSQLDRLLTPSIDILFKLFIQQSPSNHIFRSDRETAFIELNRLCEQRVIAQCLSRIGFFSRIVCGLLDDALFFDCSDILHILLRHARDSGNKGTDRKMLHRAVLHFLEEGWQDVLDLLVVWKHYFYNASKKIGYVKEMMQFLGANFNCQVK